MGLVKRGRLINLKVKLFTHTDLDGVSCGIVCGRLFDSLDITYCDYGNINDSVAQYIEQKTCNNYDLTLITDISVNEEVAELLNTEVKNKILLDHHLTAEWLNKYPWANVIAENSNGKTCGTSLVYEYFNGTSELVRFVEAVRRYDTWEWSTKYNDEQPKHLNDLMYILGRERFIDRFKTNTSINFTETEKLLLTLEQEKIDSYIEKKSNELVRIQVSELIVGVVFAEHYQSETGNRLGDKYPDIDIVAMIDPSRSVSYRTKRDNLHVGLFAKQYGGGGHPKAAGSPINEEIRNKILELVFAKSKEAVTSA